MDQNKTGGPAFPSRLENHGLEAIEFMGATIQPGKFAQFGGMTLRDHFAGLAMQALLGVPAKTETSAGYADRAYKVADAMLKARES